MSHADSAASEGQELLRVEDVVVQFVPEGDHVGPFEAQADANRRRFGRTKAEKASDKDTRERARREIDDKRLDRDE